jgi:hypothetical protein
MANLTPVPELPKSTTLVGSSNEPMPAPPRSRAFALDGSAELLAGARGRQYVLALQKPLDRGLADGEQADQERSVRNRFVPRHARPAFDGGRAMGDDRRANLALIRHGGLHGGDRYRISPSMQWL